jgi:hypothetical protein
LIWPSTVFHACGGHPGVDSLLDPYRNSHGANPAPFSFEIGQHLPPFPQLDGIDIEHGEFLPAQGAADEHGQEDVIPLALGRRPIGNGQQFPCLFTGEPVSLARSLLRDVGLRGAMER